MPRLVLLLVTPLVAQCHSPYPALFLMPANSSSATRQENINARFFERLSQYSRKLGSADVDADGNGKLLTFENVIASEEEESSSVFEGVPSLWQLLTFDAQSWETLHNSAHAIIYLVFTRIGNVGFSHMFSYLNFVQGFEDPQANVFSKILTWFQDSPKWLPPKEGEKLQIMTYQEFAKVSFNKEFPMQFFEEYFTGGRVPSWEDNDNHMSGIRILDTSVGAARAIGQEPIEFVHPLEPRFAFDHAGLMRATWHGFSYLNNDEIKFASNGDFGNGVIDALLQRFDTTDTLGVLMSDSVFSAHLTFDGGLYHLDLSSLEKYTPISGYAALGGKASFVYESSQDGKGRLRTVTLSYGGQRFDYQNHSIGSTDPNLEENIAFKSSRLVGWRFAEKAIIASLLSMTNLVLHVKDLHLEIAAAFQAVTVDLFAADTKHAVRRMLDPFVHRSVQATNDNFKLLFDYRAAEFSLAPLLASEQLLLISDSINENPLNLADMDMERYGKKRGIPQEVSEASAKTNPNTWFWRWHYRARKVQELYRSLVRCWISRNYDSDSGKADLAMKDDNTLQNWYSALRQKVPSLGRASTINPEWAPPVLDSEGLVNIASTLMVWLSWIHEDVGHSAAAYVYSPIHTPMMVPSDGVGIPFRPFAFNVAAYRGFVFLERAALLDAPPSFWFGEDKVEYHNCWFGVWCDSTTTPAADQQCFADFQSALRDLGASDTAFSECDDHGFYSCVERVETAVSS